MKKIVLFLCSAFSLLFASDNEEFRATWVITWEHSLGSAPAEKQKAHIKEILDHHATANMNAVLWQARQGGEAYYPSSYEPWGKRLDYADPGFDPLAFAVEQAHARGLELHVWFNVFASASTRPGTPAAEHPEWICRDRNGHPMTLHRSLSPGLAGVRQYLIAVAMEIVNHYDIDGLHLDYVRWNEHYSANGLLKSTHLLPENQALDGLVSPQHIEALAAQQSSRYLYDVDHPYDQGVPVGFNSWEAWWRWSVTEFVSALHDSIQASKPWVRLSAAVLGKYNWSSWQAYGTVYQDAALWYNQGFVDQLMPMHYHWFDGDGFYRMLVSDCPRCWQQYIQPGIDLGRLYSAGPPSYQLSANKIWNNHQDIAETCRTIDWVDGFQFFSYGSWQAWRYFPTAAETMFPNKTRIRATRLISSDTPVSPTLQLIPVDSLSWQLQVTPGALLDYDQWFALYRSADENIDVLKDEMIKLKYGSGDFQVLQRFDGTQDHNGRYYYAATMLDRYWNESGMSNIVSSDSLISFPPQIVDSTPSPGDTLSVSASLHFAFSKTMNPDALQISFDPEVEIASVEWSDAFTRVEIAFQERLDFNTLYRLMLQPGLIDINGSPLDGDGDGIGGDAFEMVFYTYRADILPPQLLSVYPQQEMAAVDAVFGFVFDEPLDAESFTDSTVVFSQNGESVEFNYAVIRSGNRSVISIQPFDALENNGDCRIELLPGISDTLGNAITNKIVNTFVTNAEVYRDREYLDRFWGTGNWKTPSYSGSTTGIYKPNTGISISQHAYRPGLPPPQRKSFCLNYAWDETASDHLIRVYMSGTTPRSTFFDTTWVLQCWLFGDNSNNRFRFCVDDSSKERAEFHEVSKWITIDWHGWRLVEWTLNDAAGVGSWLGDGILHGPSMRFDSFQLTRSNGSSNSGSLYFDDLRLVQKQSLTAVDENAPVQTRQPQTLVLRQNYPNPFNPVTHIAFEVPQTGAVDLRVYDIRGRQVAVLLDATVAAGKHKISFDASELPSGIYYYRLRTGKRILTKRMALIK